MATLRFAFTALLTNVNPPAERAEKAQRLPGEVREWLKDHDFDTKAPHSRLIGSYGRQTAVTEIKDVDTLLLLPTEALNRTPESILRELKAILVEYPDATADASPQRRSIRLDFPVENLCMDIVGAVADQGIEKPLWIPDRQQQKWLRSDPLGYGRTLSEANAQNGQKLIPLIKLVKAWRDVHMVNRRPKSYLLEVIVFDSVDSGSVALEGSSTAENVCDLFEHLAEKWADLMDQGTGVPRVLDPQLGSVISQGWERGHFETFMRRIREAAQNARFGIDAASGDEAAKHWQKVFGELWPTPEQVKEQARAAAVKAMPGKAYVDSRGRVSAGAVAGGTLSRPTQFHGEGR